MTQPSFWYLFVPVSVPMKEINNAQSPPIVPISVPIQGTHQALKPYTLLIYQGLRVINRMQLSYSTKEQPQQ
jgi:hypothetical protein